jgi:hypothetical protein
VELAIKNNQAIERLYSQSSICEEDHDTELSVQDDVDPNVR